MREKIVDAMLEEYRALRAEIDLYHQQQNQSVNFSLIGVVAVASASGALSGTRNFEATIVPGMLLLGLALFVTLNGIAFVDRSIRIRRIARYLDGCLREKLTRTLDGQHVWQWETFKKVSYDRSGFLTRVGLSVLDYFRLSLFWVFSAGSILLYFWKFGAAGTLPEFLLLVINVLALGVFGLASLRTQETTGSESAGILRDAVDELSKRRVRSSGGFNDK